MKHLLRSVALGLAAAAPIIAVLAWVAWMDITAQGAGLRG